MSRFRSIAGSTSRSRTADEGFTHGSNSSRPHHVADYQAWRKAYDGFGDVQKAGGATRQSVYRAADDPNNVLIMHGFATTADAENSSLAPSCAMRCSGRVSRVSHELRSTRTPCLPRQPGSPPSPVRLTGLPGCASGCQPLNHAEESRNSTAAEKPAAIVLFARSSGRLRPVTPVVDTPG